MSAFHFSALAEYFDIVCRHRIFEQIVDLFIQHLMFLPLTKTSFHYFVLLRQLMLVLWHYLPLRYCQLHVHLNIAVVNWGRIAPIKVLIPFNSFFCNFVKVVVDLKVGLLLLVLVILCNNRFSFLDFVSGLAGFAKTEALGFKEQAFATNQHRGIECDVVVS